MVIAATVMVLLLIAAVAKIVEFRSFVDSLRTWTMLSQAIHEPLAASVVLAEVFIAGAWLLGLWRRVMVVLLILLLAAYTAAFMVQSTFFATPVCRCFGDIVTHRDFTGDETVIVGRNLAAIFALLFALWKDKSGQNVQKVIAI